MYSRRLVVGAAIGFYMTCGASHGIVLVFRCIVGKLLPVFYKLKQIKHYASNTKQ